MINAWQRNLLLRKSATRQDVHVLLERSTSPSAVAEQCISGTEQGSRAVMVFLSQRCYMDNFQLEYDARHAGRPVGGCHGSFYINWSSPRDREREKEWALWKLSLPLALSQQQQQLAKRILYIFLRPFSTRLPELMVPTACGSRQLPGKSQITLQ